MKYFYIESNNTYQVYFTDGVFEKIISEIADEKIAELITELLNEAYSNGVQDGGILFLKTRYPHIYVEEVGQYFKKNKGIL